MILINGKCTFYIYVEGTGICFKKSTGLFLITFGIFMFEYESICLIAVEFYFLYFRQTQHIPKDIVFPILWGNEVRDTHHPPK